MKVFKIGADPEFTLTDEYGNHCRAVSVVGGQNDRRNFGVDGSGGPVEIRPKAEYEPIDLINNIYKCFKLGLERYPGTRDLNWRAGPNHGYSTGGHIHIGIGELNQALNTEVLMTNLDTLLLIPYVMCEDRFGLYKRWKDGYGKVRDLRTQPHGYEWRPLPSWLSSPKLAEVALSIFKAVVNDVASGVGAMSGYPAALESYNIRNFDLMRNWCVSKVFSRWTNLELYGRYRDSFEWLAGMIDGNKRFHNEFPGDIKQEWNLLGPAKKIRRIDPVKCIKSHRIVIANDEVNENV